MAERANNDQEPGTSYLHDKENQPDSLEQNQGKEATRMKPKPLKESQSFKLATDSQESTKKLDAARQSRGEAGQKTPQDRRASKLLHGQRQITEYATAKSTNNSQNQEARSSPGIQMKPNPSKRARTSSSGKSHQSNLRKNMAGDPVIPGSVEETPNRQRSTESTGEKVNTESKTTEEKGSVCVTYKWVKRRENRGKSGCNTPIIDFVKQTLETNSSIKKSGYLFICAQKYKAIVNPWVPCGALQEGEILELDLRTMKSAKSSSRERKDDVEQIVAPEMYKYSTFHDGWFFKVKHQGKTQGGQPRIIIQKTQYCSNNYPMAVFGLKDETIKQALQNDKRFTIEGQFFLEDPNCKRHESNVLLSDLKGENTYTVVLLDGGTSRDGGQNQNSVHEDLQTNTEGDTSPLPGTSVPQSEPSPDPPNQRVPVSSPLSTMFSNEFKKFAKIVGQKRVASQLVTAYKNDVVYKVPMMATTFRLLHQHLDNVALLKYDIGGKGGPSGTLFLVTESLGVTCYHVVKSLIESPAECNNVQVIFNYESEENVFCGKYIEVAWADEDLDFAFLRIEKTRSLSGLIKYITPPPQDGAVTIIGHPGGKHKQIDPNCTVIDFNQRAEAIADTIFSDRSYIHVLTKYSFMCMNDPTLVTYDSCLYEGASGAPVFDNRGELVAMHTAGYLATTTLKKKSIIEFGRSAVDITILGAIHIKELRDAFRELVREKENLKNYLQPGGHPVKMQPDVRNLQMLWEQSDRQTELNPGVNVSDITESPMDTS